MSKPDIVSILDFATWFNVKHQSKAPTGYDCGEDTSDCQGALYMLCARNLTGNADYGRWWGFEDCLMQNQTIIPQNAGACAEANKLDYPTLKKCASGSLGIDLLEASAQESLKAKVVWTPWFGIQGKYPDPPPAPPERIEYLKVICEAYAKAGGSPMPAGCSTAYSAHVRANDIQVEDY